MGGKNDLNSLIGIGFVFFKSMRSRETRTNPPSRTAPDLNCCWIPTRFADPNPLGNKNSIDIGIHPLRPRQIPSGGPRISVAKLGVGGKTVGLASDGEARIYSGYRFSDASLLRFENGRLCYQSERIAIAVNRRTLWKLAWWRRRPRTGSGNSQWCGFATRSPARFMPSSCIHWIGSPHSGDCCARLNGGRRQKPRRKAHRGFNPVAGETFRNPTIAGVTRGFLVTGGIALVAAIATCWMLRSDWQHVAWALAVTACAYASMLLPAMLYRPPSLPPELPSPVEPK